MSPLPPASWFVLRREEQFWICLILAVFLIGMIARHLHLRRQAAPPGPAEAPSGAQVSPVQN